MPTSGIRVLTIGKQYKLHPGYEVRQVEHTGDLMLAIAQFQPDVIVSDPKMQPGQLIRTGYNLRAKWIEPVGTDAQVIQAIENVYAHNIFYRLQHQDAHPLVSVYSGTYNTGSYLMECYKSLFEQTYPNWEWVCVDDFSTDGTWERLQELAKQDHRVRPFRSGKPIRKIGGVKDLATRMSDGDILVELDHDDMLTDFALAEIVKVFKEHPEVGFVYTNCSNFFENGEFHRFPVGPDWPDSQYRWTEYHGKKWLECINHDIYDRFGPNYWQQFGWFLTVGPNHARCYRATTFKQLGGYNPRLMIADDWELYARFFVHSVCYHLDKMCYLYRFRDWWQNTTFTKNQAIQDHLQLGRNFHWTAFDAFNKKRLAEDALKKKDDKVAFVVAAKDKESAKAVREQLKDQDVFVSVNAQGILDAYEQGRQHWAGRSRIVYLHDDVKIRNVGEFVGMVKTLCKGTHGVVGTADPAAWNKEGWWDGRDNHGKISQQYPEGVKVDVFGDPKTPHEVVWLDGLCLVTVDQTWDWKVPGKPKVWHGYDWIACKRTREAGSKCLTISQPGEPFLYHKGIGRTEGLAEAMSVLRTLSRAPSDRRDYPNIKDHLPRLEQAAKGNVLELGSRDGASTASFLAGVEKKGGFVWSVDVDPQWAGAWQGHSQWQFILADSCDVEKIDAAGLKGVQLDLLFIDTEHTYEQASKELALWADRVAPTGQIILHDTAEFPGVRRAIEEWMAKRTGVTVDFLNNCNGLAVIRFGTSCPAMQETGEQGKPGDFAVMSDSTTADVSYVIPVAKQQPHLLRCLQSIRRWSPKSEVIIVANGCPIDGEARKLADKVVSLEINARFGAGCNRGVMDATRTMVCILNDDAEFVDETPTKLVEATAKRRRITAPYCDRAKPPQGDIPKTYTPAESRVLDMVVGVCMILPTALYRALGGFDTRLDTYEDDDFCYRARSLYGVESEVVGGTWVHHDRHATFMALGEDVQAIMRNNGQIFAKKHPRIHVIAIAKNEEKSIKDFFEQFRGITRNWFLLDTGSTDRTVEIAQSMGVCGASVPFTDFAQARNEARKRFAQGADWVIEMDLDERLDSHTLQHLRESLFKTDYDIFLAPLWAKNPDGSETEWVAKPFLYRNLDSIHWINKVHEKLVGSVKQAQVVNGRINHILSLHEDGRRGAMRGFYDMLQAQEPFYTDPAYQTKIRAQWPILDYNHRDDPRIDKVHWGPLISVVVPTYKRAALLQKALQSAYEQDYLNIDVVVVGDNCPDLARLQMQPNPVLRVFNLPKNHGAGGAEPRNCGIVMAAGSLIAYLDDDNEWKPNHLSSLYAALRKDQAAFSWSSMQIDGKDFGFTGELKQGEIDTSCVLHQKALIEWNGWWKDRQAGGYAHDWEFFSRWAKEKHAFSGQATVIYNADTSGQAEYLRSALAARKNGKGHSEAALASPNAQ